MMTMMMMMMIIGSTALAPRPLDLGAWLVH